MAAPTNSIDTKFTTSQFAVTFDDMPRETFVQSVSGLSWEFEVTSWAREGGGPPLERPGHKKLQDVTIKRLYGPDAFFSDWMGRVAHEYEPAEKSGQIDMLDRAGSVLGTWELQRCWPSSWKISDPGAGTDDVMTEEVTIVLGGLARRDGSGQAPLSGAQSAKRQYEDYDRSFLGSLFRLTVEGQEMGFFTGVGGISIDVGVVKHAFGNQLDTVRSPGNVTYGDINLKRGYAKTAALTKWFENWDHGSADPTTGAIEILGPDGQRVVDTIALEGAWPKRWSQDDLSVDSDAKVIEEVTLSVDRIMRQPA